MGKKKTTVYDKVIELFNQQLLDGSVLDQDNGYMLQFLLYTFAQYHYEIKQNIKDQKIEQRLDKLHDAMVNYIKLLFVEVQKNGNKG